jgi:hypothetical protein
MSILVASGHLRLKKRVLLNKARAFFSDVPPKSMSQRRKITFFLQNNVADLIFSGYRSHFRKE